MIRINRLCHVVVHASFQAAIAVACHGVGRHRHDRKIGKLRQFPNFPCRGQTVHHGHLHIHQHCVVSVGSVKNFIDRDRPVFSDFNDQSGGLQQLPGHFLIEFVILDQQDAGAGDGAQISLRNDGWCSSLRDVLVGTPKRAHHRFEHDRGTRRFDQQILDARFPGGQQDFIAAIRCHHQQMGGLGQHQFANGLCGRDSVHSRHLPVEKDNFVGLARRFSALYLRHRQRAGSDCRYDERHAAQLIRDDFAGVLVVVHHQDTTCAQIRPRQAYPRAGLAALDLGGEPESGADAGLTLHAHLPAHQFCKLLGYRKPESCSAILARGR